MIKYILTTLLFSTFLSAEDNYIKPTPTFTISDDDNDKTFARSRKGKKSKGRRKGGWGLR